MIEFSEENPGAPDPVPFGTNAADVIVTLGSLRSLRLSHGLCAYTAVESMAMNNGQINCRDIGHLRGRFEMIGNVQPAGCRS